VTGAVSGTDADVVTGAGAGVATGAGAGSVDAAGAEVVSGGGVAGAGSVAGGAAGVASVVAAGVASSARATGRAVHADTLRTTTNRATFTFRIDMSTPRKPPTPPRGTTPDRAHFSPFVGKNGAF